MVVIMKCVMIYLPDNTLDPFETLEVMISLVLPEWFIILTQAVLKRILRKTDGPISIAY